MPSVPPARTLWATHKVSLSSPSEHCMIAWPIACRKESRPPLQGVTSLCVVIPFRYKTHISMG